MSKLDKIAEKFGLEEYRDYKIENGTIYIIQHQEFSGSQWLFFAKKEAYKNDYVEMFRDIKKYIK